MKSLREIQYGVKDYCEKDFQEALTFLHFKGEELVNLLDILDRPGISKDCTEHRVLVNAQSIAAELMEVIDGEHEEKG